MTLVDLVKLTEATYCEVSNIDDKSFELTISSSYSAPEINFKILLAFSEYFGTTEIDVDNYSIDNPGCDTCDWSSEYGHTIQIYKPTKNIGELRGYVGKKNIL